MMFLWLLLIGLVLYFVLVKPGKRTGETTKSAEDPEEVLKKRFVNGEITAEEYKNMLKIVNE